MDDPFRDAFVIEMEDLFAQHEVCQQGGPAFARAQAHSVPDPSGIGRSARNRFVGLVTAIASDKVMSQVEMQCGPHRVVSLMSTEAVEELGLEVGSLAVSVVKATHIIVETPGGMA